MIFVLIFATLILPGCRAQFAVHLQESGEFKLEYMQYKDPVALPDKFSVCFRFQLGLERGPNNYIFSYSLPGNYKELNFYIRHETRTGSICLENSCGEFLLTGDLRSGYSLICALVKDMYSQSTSVELFYDGNLAVSLKVNTIIPEGDEVTQGILILGQDQDMHGGGFDIKQSFSGLISQFNIFNRIITELEIQAMQDCTSKLSGELVSWDNLFWLIQGDIKVYPIQNTSVYCRTSLLSELVSVPEPLDFSAADFTCNFLGGRIQAPVDSDQTIPYNKIKTEFPKLQGTDCSNEDGELMYWMGSTFKDGSWIDYQTGETLKLENVKGLKTEQDGCLMNYFGELQARECKRKFCSICKLRENRSPILVKGICSLETEENKNFDTIFYPSGIRNGRIYFRGSGFSHLYYKPEEGDTSDSRTGNWIIQSLRDPTLEIILLKKYSKLYPFGRYIWEVGSKEVCDLVPGTPLPLTFTSCPEESFTCNSGECIPLANKCNSKIDCTDESDESECNYLQVPDVYSGHLGPRSKGNQPVPVYINISILAFPDIDTMGLKFTSDYYINLRWYDGRLSFKDLNDNSILNNVQLEALTTMWSPQLAFLNALGPFQTVVDDLSVCTIVLEKAPTFDDKTNSWEYYGFDGEYNAINMIREYYQDYSCEFDLSYYPFDTQVCHMLFELQGFTKEFISLKVDQAGVEYLGKRDLLEYQIQDEHLFIDNSNEGSRAEVKVVFRRRIEYHLFGVFVQQKILIVVGFLTFYFEVTNFSDRVMVSLTLMLVIATISDGIKVTLPATPYLKLIDIWLFFSMNLMVLTLLFHTILLHRVLRENKVVQSLGGGSRPRSAFTKLLRIQDADVDSETLTGSIRLNRVGKVLYAGSTLTFWFFFWIMALIEFFRPAEQYINQRVS